jgi:hypothetical protein
MLAQLAFMMANAPPLGFAPTQGRLFARSHRESIRRAMLTATTLTAKTKMTGKTLKTAMCSQVMKTAMVLYERLRLFVRTG